MTNGGMTTIINTQDMRLLLGADSEGRPKVSADFGDGGGYRPSGGTGYLTRAQLRKMRDVIDRLLES